jgi:hypothetical protein
MPTRKPKGRPIRPEPQADPERQHEDAMRFLRQEYYGGVRGIVEDLKARVASGEIASEDDLNDAVHQEVDGSYWVIYTHANFQVLLCSDHHDAYFEEYGEAPIVDGDINWAALAFATLDRDVRDLMGAEDVRVVEERRRCTGPRRPRARGPRRTTTATSCPRACGRAGDLGRPGGGDGEAMDRRRGRHDRVRRREGRSLAVQGHH